MSIDPNADTPLSQQAVEPVVEPPSWLVRVVALETADAKHDARLSALEGGFARLESKTDAQTVILGEIKGALFSGAKTAWDALKEHPWVRRLVFAVAVAVATWGVAWLRKHGIAVEWTP